MSAQFLDYTQRTRQISTNLFCFRSAEQTILVPKDVAQILHPDQMIGQTFSGGKVISIAEFSWAVDLANISTDVFLALNLKLS